MSSGSEFTTVESPFIDYLIGMSWKLVTGSVEQPSATARATFHEVLIGSDLRKAIECISLRDTKPRLDDASVAQAVSASGVVEVQKPRVMHCGVVENRLSRGVRVRPFSTEIAA